jgi:hypothetical protein
MDGENGEAVAQNGEREDKATIVLCWHMDECGK